VKTQAIAAVTRQIVAVLASIYGIASTHISAIHLPPAVAAILTAAGPVILAIEHFVGDPSTGTAAQAVKVIDATPEVNRIVAEARAELVAIVNAAKVFVAAPVPPVVPPVAVPVASVPVEPHVAL
jgi:hypothetical protein